MTLLVKPSDDYGFTCDVAVHGGHHGLARIRSLLKVRLGWNIQLDVYCVEFESPCSDFRTYCWGFEIQATRRSKLSPIDYSQISRVESLCFMTGDFDASASLRTLPMSSIRFYLWSIVEIHGERSLRME